MPVSQSRLSHSDYILGDNHQWKFLKFLILLTFNKQAFVFNFQEVPMQSRYVDTETVLFAKLASQLSIIGEQVAI